MGMQFTLDDEAQGLLCELMALTGLSAEALMTEAVQLRVAAARDQAARQARTEQILTLAAALRAHLPADMSSDHRWLYDRDGMPA